MTLPSGIRFHSSPDHALKRSRPSSNVRRSQLSPVERYVTVELAR